MSWIDAADQDSGHPDDEKHAERHKRTLPAFATSVDPKAVAEGHGRGGEFTGGGGRTTVAIAARPRYLRRSGVFGTRSGRAGAAPQKQWRKRYGESADADGEQCAAGEHAGGKRLSVA